MRRCFWFVRLLIPTLIGFAALPVWAGYPQPTESWVNDFAGVLSSADEQRLRAPLERLRRGHGIEAVVVTVPSYRGYGTGDGSIESFATGLFNDWGVGHRGRDDGAVVVLAVEDREVRIEVGEGWGRTYDSRFEDIISEEMVPRFKNGDLAGGLEAGVEALEIVLVTHHPVEDLRSEPSATTPPAVSSSRSSRTPEARPRSDPSTAPRARQPRRSPSPARRPTPASLRLSDSGWSETERGLLTLSILSVLLALGFAVHLWIRRVRYRCPECRGEMARLTEKVEDQFLETGQQVEETMGSVGYDVLRCPSCQAMKILSRNRWLSPAQRCQECGYRTVRTSARILSHPTYDVTGRKEVTHLCQHCKWKKVETRILPRLERPQEEDSFFSSSSHSFYDRGGSSGSRSWGGASSGRSSSGGSSSGGGASFGGGRSSGGGASGKW